MPQTTLRANARTMPTPRRAPGHITPAMRARMETAVERLLATLDAFDAVAEDLEEGCDAEAYADDAEPSLGATHGLDQNAAWFSDGGAVLDGEMEAFI